MLHENSEHRLLLNPTFKRARPNVLLSFIGNECWDMLVAARFNAQAALPSVALWSEDKIATQIAEFENNKNTIPIKQLKRKENLVIYT